METILGIFLCLNIMSQFKLSSTGSRIQLENGNDFKGGIAGYDLNHAKTALLLDSLNKSAIEESVITGLYAYTDVIDKKTDLIEQRIVIL